MAESSGVARPKPLHRGLPDEIVIWEILVRLPPESLLRCRAVCRAWSLATSTHDFLLAHHHHQPSLSVLSGSEYRGRHHEIHAFDHRALSAHLRPVARLDQAFNLEASCDGLLILYTHGTTGPCYSVCNLATRQHAPLRQLSSFGLFNLLGMYLHRPTGEYRLLLHLKSHWGFTIGHRLPKGKIGCYVFVLGSDQQPRYIGGPDAAAAVCLEKPALLCDSLHWYPMQPQGEGKGEGRAVLVFDTTTESFRQMRAPRVPIRSNIVEMDDTFGIYSYKCAMKIVDIWVLQNYEAEVWDYKYRVELPVAQIRGQFGLSDGHWEVSVACGHENVFLMVSYGSWMFYVDTDGKLVANFHCVGRELYDCQLRLKQTLVQHTFFTALEGYAVNASPFV